MADGRDAAVTKQSQLSGGKLGLVEFAQQTTRYKNSKDAVFVPSLSPSLIEESCQLLTLLYPKTEKHGRTGEPKVRVRPVFLYESRHWRRIQSVSLRSSTVGRHRSNQLLRRDK